MSATFLKIHLTMSERTFRTLQAAVQYASDEVDNDMEKLFDHEYDGERLELADLINELREAQQKLRAKGADV